MAEPPVVVTRALEAVFDGGDGVGPLDLVVEPGEAVLVIGPSGSGKSTLLRMLHGAVPRAIPARVTGCAAIAGLAVADHGVAALARVVGVVAQDPVSGVCLPDVEDEIAFPLENQAVDPSMIGEAVAAALERVGASELRGRRTTELSGGELQRIALAAATAAAPPLLLLDEPTAMLDAAGVRAVRAAVAQVRARTGAACVLVEHRLDELAGHAGLSGLPRRWIVLGRTGRVVHDGPPEALGTAALRTLLGEGCWLPIELELRAVLGDDRVADAAELERRAIALAATSEPAAPEPVGPSSAAGPSLRARGLSVTAGDPRSRRSRGPVLTGIDLELRAGDTVALVGANGSGKSTLLACLAGVSQPTAGTVEGPRAGLVMQHPEHQFAATTAAGEIAHGLRDCTQEQVARALADVGLGELAARDPHRLSGGQQRRLSLAAMLMHDRPFLLADEPAFGLDRRGVIETMRALRAAASAGRGVLFTSHDLRAVVGYADRVLVIGDGGLVGAATPLALLRDPRLLAAAGMEPSSLLRRVAETAVDERHAQRVLRGLDALALGAGAAEARR